jgi:hypothetical protein
MSAIRMICPAAAICKKSKMNKCVCMVEHDDSDHCHMTNVTCPHLGRPVECVPVNESFQYMIKELADE